jgi:ribonuclease P protein component
VTLPKAARLLRRREFLRVQQKGRRLYSGEVLVIALDSGCTRPRIGITVSSKIANAVGRNRVKRWVREAFRGSQGAFGAVDLVVIGGVQKALAAAAAAAALAGGPP